MTFSKESAILTSERIKMQKGDKVIVDNIDQYQDRHSDYLNVKGVVLCFYNAKLSIAVKLETGSIVAFAESELKLDTREKTNEVERRT